MKPVFSFCAVLLAVSGFAGESAATRAPVLVELFTSEGCSSCPPADRLLQKFDKEQPVAGADLIVLSEHVDYWNQQGWKDPFSSAQFTQRQHEYARGLGGDVYTPEMVVDGAKAFVGNDEAEAGKAIRDAAHQTKAQIRIEVGQKKISLHMDHGAEGTLYLALAHDSKSSQVTAGENSGHALSHVAVVYSLRKIGKITGDSAFDREITLTPNAGEKTRIVAFIAKPEFGRVVAVGQARL